MPTIPYAQPPVIHQESGNFSDIPVPHRLSVDELTKLKENSQSVGNFACNLTRRLYPELFGPDNLRKKFNYRGEKKTELDPQRKTYLQRYILYFFPEVRDNKAWQRKVINPINEVLRR